MRGARRRPPSRCVSSLVLLLIPAEPAAALAALQAAPQPPAAPETPFLRLEFFDWELTLESWEGLRTWAEVRGRTERWSHLHNAGQDGRYDYEHLRVRQGIAQKLEPVELGFEWQAVNLFGVDEDAPTGPGKTYLDANGNGSPQSLSVRQLYAELVAGGVFVRAGRQLYEDGGGIKYDDPAFQYVRERGTARLVGNLDWTAAGRTFDGASLRREDAGWVVRAIGFEANQGAFAVDDAGNSLEDVQVGGLEVVNRRGGLLPWTEARGFGYVFRDDRPVATARVGDELFVTTLGGQLASRGQVGPGSADAFLWAAHQTGDAGTSSQRAGAWIAEAGFRFDGAPLKPWLRAGHARGQGDSNPNDGESNDFYNGLPTNHTYYGYADLFALTNLRDTYVDLMLDLHPQVRFVAGFHDFALNDGDSPAFFGSGPFHEQSFGYGTYAATSRNLGQELDLTLRASSAGGRVWVLLGYSRFWGQTAFERLFQHEDVDFGYLELGFRL